MLWPFTFQDFSCHFQSWHSRSKAHKCTCSRRHMYRPWPCLWRSTCLSFQPNSLSLPVGPVGDWTFWTVVLSVLGYCATHPSALKRSHPVLLDILQRCGFVAACAL
jgi:hypothetical protein